MKYYISADWVLRSSQLEDFFEDSLEQEDATYQILIREEEFYGLAKNEDTLIYEDLQKGAKTESVIEDGISCIKITVESFRYFIEIETPEELQEFIFGMGGGDVKFCAPTLEAIGLPDPNEDSNQERDEFPDAWMIELQDSQICPDCGGRISECGGDEE